MLQLSRVQSYREGDSSGLEIIEITVIPLGNRISAECPKLPHRSGVNQCHFYLTGLCGEGGWRHTPFFEFIIDPSIYRRRVWIVLMPENSTFAKESRITPKPSSSWLSFS